MELLADIERLKKETEELKSEKGMATDIQVNSVSHWWVHLVNQVSP